MHDVKGDEVVLLCSRFVKTTDVMINVHGEDCNEEKRAGNYCDDGWWSCMTNVRASGLRKQPKVALKAPLFRRAN